MQSFIALPYRLEREAPSFEGPEIKYPEALVRHFLKIYTERGDRVFDPFSGHGTSLFVAEAMGRIAYGVEADPRRYAWVAGQLKSRTHLKWGDSARLAQWGFPKMDFSMSSPPFMARNHRWNPLYAGDPLKAGYDRYLRRLGFIYGKVALLMKRNARIVVQVDNLRARRSFTPLVRDISFAVSRVLHLENEVIVAWRGGPADYAHTHCLVFRK